MKPYKLCRLQYLLLFAVISIAQTAALAQEFVVLPAKNWQLRRKNAPLWISSTIPSTVQNELLKKGMIKDPFINNGEKDIKWVGYADWEYKCTFDIEPKLLSHGHVDLCLDGVDTYADIVLNDVALGKTENMFRLYAFNAKGILKPKGNVLYIKLKSPFKTNVEKWKASTLKYPSINEENFTDTVTSMFSRKAPYHFGWDWGPRILAIGVYKPVFIKAWSDVVLNDFVVRTATASPDTAVIEVETEIESDRVGSVNIKFTMGDYVARKAFDVTKGVNIYKFVMGLSKPQLWYPYTHGNPYLYEAKMELSMGSTYQRFGRKIGIRKLEMVRDKDAVGESFYVRVNGVPVFAKGANMVPLDNLLDRVTEAKYRKLFEQAKDANMNMLRVWGGGIYEFDDFYRIADEKGFLIWHDLMFSCAFYPADEAFKKNVEQELLYQMKRLRNFASIALWVGNNEIEYGWKDWGWYKKYAKDSAAFFSNYKQIHYDLIPQVLAKYDPTRLYWQCSPMAAPMVHSNNLSGDEHIWQPWFGRKPFSFFHEYVPRFASEYGFQGMPDERYLASVLPEAKPLTIKSPELRQRQKSPMGFINKGRNGTDHIIWYTNEYYKINESTLSLEDLAYYGQLMQAEGNATAIAAHRSAKPYCMGSMFWQINDCWPSISWSSVDFNNQPKALHYAAKNYNAPIALLPRFTGDSAYFHLVHDGEKAVDLNAKVVLKGFSGKTIATLVDQSYTTHLTAAQRIYAQPLKPILNGASADTTYIVTELSNGLMKYHSNIVLPVRDKQAKFSNAKPEVVSVTQTTTPNKYEVKVKSDKFCRKLRLRTKNADSVFEDNYLDIEPGTTVSYIVKMPAGMILYRQDLELKWLND